MMSLHLHLQDCAEMEGVGRPISSDPPAVGLLEAPLLRRQVWLHPPSLPSKPLVYATSWWNAAVRLMLVASL